MKTFEKELQDVLKAQAKPVTTDVSANNSDNGNNLKTNE